MKKLKKETLVQEIFLLITQKCLEQQVDDTGKIELPFTELIAHLNKKYSTSYHSILHLHNQLKSYEKELSLTLFNKMDSHAISISLDNFSNFSQRKLLNQNLKLMLVNGVVDLFHQINKETQVLNVYLGTGTECYYLAQFLFEQWEYPLNIFTHNLGIIQLFCEYESKLSNITLRTRNGTVDEVSFTLVDSEVDYFNTVDFDAIIQSPRYIEGETLYVVSSIERTLKQNIATNSKGIKILLFTLFEFLLPDHSEKQKMFPFSNVREYDYVITPPKSINEHLHTALVASLPLTLYINYFSYNIYTVNK